MSPTRNAVRVFAALIQHRLVGLARRYEKPTNDWERGFRAGVAAATRELHDALETSPGRGPIRAPLPGRVRGGGPD